MRVACCSQDSETLFHVYNNWKEKCSGFLNDLFIHEATDFQDLLLLICSFADQLDSVSLRTRSSCVDLLNGIERQQVQNRTSGVLILNMYGCFYFT